MKIFKTNDKQFTIHDTYSSVVDDTSQIIIILLCFFGFWFNHKYCGGSIIMNILIFILCCSMLWIFSENKTTITKEELLVEINKLN
jgi:hypothetical protein